MQCGGDLGRLLYIEMVGLFISAMLPG